MASKRKGDEIPEWVWLLGFLGGAAAVAAFLEATRKDRFTCPTCKTVVNRGVERCPTCGTVFDWSKLPGASNA